VYVSEQKEESEFWYRFDNQYAWESTETIDTGIKKMRKFSIPRKLGTLSSSKLKTYLENDDGKDLKNTVKEMLPAYFEIFHKHFGTDFEQKEVINSLLWKSLKDFGLGVLYDPRPPRDRSKGIHVMDGGMLLYALWHRFNWIASIVKPESPFSQPMLYLDRLVGLSAEVYSISKPCQTSNDGRIPDSPPNGGNITEDQIEELTNVWSKLSFDEIENRMSQLKDHESYCFQ